MNQGGYIYIISNENRTVFYIGVTAFLYKRITNHKNLQGSNFAIRYNCTDLLYYEFHSRIEFAIKREKQLKKWKREYKQELIQNLNPEMKDLYFDLDPFVDPIL